MTTNVDIINRALQEIGTRTTVTQSELDNETSNEAIQANIAYDNVRKRLLRMAPWTGGLKTGNLVYITSAPGTPENQSNPTNRWERGQPTPPWIYEYQYPVDCLDSCWIVPAFTAGFVDGAIPISPVTTNIMIPSAAGQPVKYAVQTDIFRPVTAATVVGGGSGYAVGDEITLESGDSTEAPMGAPCKLRVAAVSGGVITSVTVISQVLGSNPGEGGSYFDVQTNPVAQGETTGAGTGATFNLTQGSPSPQRVILTNQQQATLVYVQDVTNMNVLDDMFQDTFAKILGSQMVVSLTGDKKLANGLIEKANYAIQQTRNSDAQEGLVINDVTPDWIRIRGIDFGNQFNGPFTGFDWGGFWPMFG